MATHLETFADNGLSEPFYWLTRPTAVYYKSRTYVVWHGVNFDPHIIYYDHVTKIWSQVVCVADNPMSGNGHGAPAMIIDSNGYIHVFYGATIGGGYPLKHAISNNPESISSFIVKPNIGKYNYPKPINIGNTLYLFAMGPSETDNSGAQYLSYQIWNGSYWETSKSIISANTGINTYVGFMEYRDNKVHVTWCFYDRGADKMMNIYYAYLNMSDMNMYSANGTNLGPMISKSEADAYCMVRNSGSNNSNTASMHLDSNGYPWIIYPEGSGKNWKFYHTRWTGNSWTAPAFITTTDYMYNYEDFKINSINDVTAYLNTSGKPCYEIEPCAGGDIEEWHWNGSVWSKVYTILSESSSGKPLGGPNIPYDDHEVKLVFSQYLDDDFDDSTLKLYALVEDDIIPVPMKYTCSGAPNYLCYENVNGVYSTPDACQSACKAIVSKRYSCSGPPYYLCFEDPNGEYDTQSACMVGCLESVKPPEPPVMLYLAAAGMVAATLYLLMKRGKKW